MTLPLAAVSWLAAAATLLALDAVWLSLMTSRFIRPAIGHLMADQVSWAPAVVFYALYVAGIVWFAVAPAVEERRVWTGALNGAVLGFLAYATYDLTNQSTLRDWPLSMTVVDIAWGMLVTAVAATAGSAAALWAQNAGRG